MTGKLPERPPVALKERRLACENSKWRVYLDHVADGPTEVTDHLVVAPKVHAPGLVSGVAVLPVVAGAVILLRSYRHAIGAWAWEVPRGFVDEGESAAASALRELEEEAGLTCAPADLRFAGHATPESSTIMGRAALFVAENCRPCGPSAPGEPGLGQAHRLDFTEVRRMLDRFEIEDAVTLALLGRFPPLASAAPESRR
jgi:ADP-ribose pyrophosphatase